MKQNMCILTLLCMLLAFTGCGKQPYTETTAKHTEATENTAESTDYVPQQEPMAAVAVPAITETVYAEDGTPIFSYTHQNILLTTADPEVADKVIIDFLGRMDATRGNADKTLASAKAAYNSSANWSPYLSSIAYSPTRIDQGVLSLFGSHITYAGASHPERAYISANYDLVTGDALTLGSIMSAKATMEDFSALTLEALAAQKNEKYLYDGYEETVRQRFHRDESKDQDWFFSQAGLCFYFAPYEIASYASGVIIAVIPYDKLAGLLYDGYFPAEREAAEGDIRAALLEEANLDAFSQIAELVLDPEGQMVFLSTDGLVWDVQLEVGTLDLTGTEFTPAYTALLSHALSPGDAIMVQLQFNDAEPMLRLTYHTKAGRITRYITQSGKDSSILLTQ